MFFYVYSFIITVFVIFSYSIFEFFYKNKNFFFLNFKINFIIYFQVIFFLIFIFFILLLEIYLLTFFFFEYLLPNFLIFIKDFLNIFLNNTAFCAGVPHLIDLCSVKVKHPSDANVNINKKILEYIESNNIKSISKYTFSLLDRKDNFYNYQTSKELEAIFLDLNYIYRSNFEITKSLLSEEELSCLDLNQRVIKIKNDIKLLYSENVYKRRALELCNAKLGIPLYKNFCNTIFISKKKILPLMLQSKIPIMDITLNNICPFLIDENVIKVLNCNEKFTHLKIINGLDKPKEFNIVNDYFLYTKNMCRALSQLTLTNERLLCLEKLLSIDKYKNAVVFGKTDFKVGDDIVYAGESGKNKILLDAAKIFEKPFDYEKVSPRFKAIDNIFLREIQKDKTLLKNIKTQKSNMVVNYEKLIQIISDSEQKYFDSKTKKRILLAKDNIFTIKKKTNLLNADSNNNCQNDKNKFIRNVKQRKI